jgi:PKD repeat protein
MCSRRLFQVFLTVLGMLCILMTSGIVSAQGRNDQAFERVREIQERQTTRLMALPGVVGTAIGESEDARPVILVMLEHGAVAGVPAQLEGINVQRMVTGPIYARDSRTGWCNRPVPIGVSTGHPDITAGTIGCRVKDASGQVYALSNNHVYANINAASIGDNVLQPGPYDGGRNPGDAIGKLWDYQEIYFDSRNNFIDAAIALSSEAALDTATLADGYGIPNAIVAEAALRQKVKKYGRTTGLTSGQVEGLNATVNVNFGAAGTARFVGQILIRPGSFSQGGDSGSLIVTEKGNHPVGLLFAGSSTVTIANPIGPVLEHFKVSIDDGSGGTTENQPPTASFDWFADGLTVNFTDASTDTDGFITSWRWDFGDEENATDQNPFHTYAAAGTYTVALTVTDNDGAEDTISESVSVTVIDESGPVLTATGYKERGMQKANLSWTGASGSVTVHRADKGMIAANIATGEDGSGSWVDNINARGGGTYTYWVIDNNGNRSNDSIVNF